MGPERSKGCTHRFAPRAGEAFVIRVTIAESREEASSRQEPNRFSPFTFARHGAAFAIGKHSSGEAEEVLREG